MYKNNPNILVEDTSDNEMIMFNQESKSTIVLNYTAKLLYESFIDSDYTTGVNRYFNKVSEIFNINAAELENDAIDTFKYLLQNDILVEEY